MARVELKGLHRVRVTRAGGLQVTYSYAWRGGPALVDKHKRPLKEGTPEFHLAFVAAHQARKMPSTRTMHDLVFEFRAGTEFTGLSKASQRNYGMMLKRIEGVFGDLPLEALSDPAMRGEFKAWRDTLADKPRTADYAWMVLSRVLSVAKDRGKISVNPCERGGRLYKSERIDLLWTEDALSRLFAVCSPEIYDAVTLALWTGQRQGDLLAATWSAFDGTYMRLRQGKTGRRVTIPAGPTLAAALKAIPRGKSTQILTSSEGRPWTSDGFRTSWGRAVAKAGLAGLTFHDLRGTAVTRLAIAGCTPAEIATITGHSLRDVTTILDRHYLSRDVKLAEQAIRKLERNEKRTRSVKSPVKRPVRPRSEQP